VPTLCVSLVLVAASASAQTASPEDIAAARSLGTDGTRLADSGDCNAAIPKLEAAEKLYHAPTTLDRLGECQISVGRLVAGTESLNRVMREPLAPNAPAAFVAAKKRAEQALQAATPRIGNLKVHVDGASPDKVTVTVDGVAVSSALLDADRPTDPGNHEVGASAPGYKASNAVVTVREGAESTVSLKLEVDPTAVAPPPPPAPGAGAATSVAVSTTTSPSGPNTTRTIAYVAFGAGGVGLALGAVFGVLALGNKSSLDNACTNKVCPSSSQSDINAIGTNSTVSTIGFVLGVAGVATGVILLVASHKNEATASAPPRPHIEPWIGLGSAGVGGTFQ
jgi:PEGA domain